MSFSFSSNVIVVTSGVVGKSNLTRIFQIMDTGRRSNANKKTIFKSSNLVNKNASKLGQK